MEKDQAVQQQNMQMQAKTNIETQQAAAEMEMEKNKVMLNNQKILEEAKAGFESLKMEQ